MTFRYVEIVWEDAHGGDEGWLSAPPGEPARIVTVGLLYEETEKGYLVVLSYDEALDRIGAYMFIPKSCVVKGYPKTLRRSRG